MAALDPDQLGHWIAVILQVAFALGFVIFVHELGHFAVAKLCGVKCEKFMIGFDIGGLKLSRKWGETEYGIGILPLGGYVKMLGQDDNPANIAEQVRQSQVSGASPEAKEIIGPDGKTYVVDRRSYLAKSVPQRMAIISAGVIMNVIFAFIFAVVAYKIGVPYNPCIVSKTAPGSPAWRAGIQPGDEIVQVGDIVSPSFTDLMGSVTLGDLERGLPFVIQRGSVQMNKTLVPEQGSDLARIGVSPPYSLRLHPRLAAYPHSPAANATPPLEKGDEIVAVDGTQVKDYAELTSLLVQHPEKLLTFTVRRGGKPPENDLYGKHEGGEMVDVKIGPHQMRTLGLVMQMSPIAAVQENSPAADAGLKSGDIIDRIQPTGDDAASDDKFANNLDPLKLPENLRRLAEEGGSVQITLRKKPAEERAVSLRKVDQLEEPIAPDDPVSAPALGISYRVLSVVDRVEPGSPAEQAGLQGDDVLLKAEWVYPDDVKDKPEDPAKVDLTQEAGDGGFSWASIMQVLQDRPEGTRIRLTYKRGGEVREALLTPVAAEGYFVPERGLALEPVTRNRVSQTWSEAAQRGWDETVRSLTMVYRFLGKLGTQVPVTALGGPVTIAKAAGFSAFEGPGKLLVFLTMLSANLAVLNFLPIPLLDGGHMVFLAWEGVRGKPAGERFVVAMQTAGMVFIITLMLFVISLDLQRLFFA
jgi:regulator of sigma E protease